MRYRVFGRHTGLRISELVLGTGMFGTKWGYGANPEESRLIFDGYLEAGGNFIDTSDSYQFGEAESLIGEFIRPVRDDVVLATKFTQSDDPKGSLSVTGNSRKAMVRSLEQSLKRLKTDRIDLYWVHMPDDMTPIDEIVRGLDDLVRAGKVLYAGLSDFPAWRVSAAAMLSEMRGWAPIVARKPCKVFLRNRTTSLRSWLKVCRRVLRLHNLSTPMSRRHIGTSHRLGVLLSR